MRRTGVQYVETIYPRVLNVYLCNYFHRLVCTKIMESVQNPVMNSPSNQVSPLSISSIGRENRRPIS